jgi:hypothetical protein
MTIRFPSDLQRAERARKWYAANKDRANARALAAYHAQTPKQRAQLLARANVRDALKAGRITREPCLFCDVEKVEAHHHDYSLRLVVTWLCHHHHRLAHGGSFK